MQPTPSAIRARPLDDHIIVLQDAVRDDVTPAGLLIAASRGIVDSKAQLGRAGTVLAIGPGVDAEQLPVGSRILFGEFDHPTYVEDGVQYLMLQDKDVCGVLED